MNTSSLDNVTAIREVFAKASPDTPAELITGLANLIAALKPDAENTEAIKKQIVENPLYLNLLHTLAKLPPQKEQPVQVTKERAASNNADGGIILNVTTAAQGDAAGRDIYKGSVTFNISIPSAAPGVTAPPKSRVFMSYDATTAAEQDVLDWIRDTIKRKGLELVGEQEHAKGAWSNDLFAVIGSAHGAVLLLTRSALDSALVREEAGILAWRRSLDKYFVLMTVLLEPLTSAQLEEKGFPPLDLLGLGPAPPAPIDPTAEAEIKLMIEESFKAISDPRRIEVPFETLIDKVAKCLSGLRLEVIKEKAQEMSLDISGWTDADTPRFLASALLRGDPATYGNSLSNLIRAAHESDIPSSTESGNARTLLEKVMPTWINPCVARWLPLAAFSTRDRRAVLFKDWTKDSILRLVERAKQFSKSGALQWTIIEVAPPGEDDENAYKGQLRKALFSLFDFGSSDDSLDELEDRNAKLSPEQLQKMDRLIEAQLKEDEEDGMPVVVAYYGSILPIDIQQSLRSIYPTITFLFAGDVKQGLSSAQAGIYVASPPFDQQRASDADTWYYLLQNRLRKRAG